MITLSTNGYSITADKITTWIPAKNGVPDFSGLSEPYRTSAEDDYRAWIADGNVLPVPEPVIPTPIKDWDNLNNAVLGGSLNPFYNRLTEASFVNPATVTLAQIGEANNIAVAAGKIDQSVAYTRIEEAVAASFNLLNATSSYKFTAEEIATWNATVTALGFSPVMFLA